MNNYKVQQKNPMKSPCVDGYHLVMTNIAMENHHAINR